MGDHEITTKYSCHAWTNDGFLIIATEAGEIVICEGSGQFEGIVSLPPGYDKRVDAILTKDFPRGFIVSTEGMLQPYEKADDEGEEPYRPMTANPMKVHEAANKDPDLFVGPSAGKRINSLCLPPSGEHIYYITENQQLLKAEIPMYDEADPNLKVEQVHDGFHHKEVTGLDVCIRKQLIVTCSLDKSIRIWNYVNRTCEILHPTSEECYAVAFHPSGFHLVVSTGDKIMFMNVLSKSL
jgi:cilia- and flagella-associated protein 57